MAERYTRIRGKQILDGTVEPKDLKEGTNDLAGIITYINNNEFKKIPYQTVYNESLGISSTTSSTWQDKVSITINPPEEGEYIILFSCEITNDTQGGIVRVRLHDSNDNNHARDIWKVVSGTVDEWHLTSGCVCKTLDSSITYTLQFKRENSTGTAKIRRAHLLAMRRIK